MASQCTQEAKKMSISQPLTSKYFLNSNRKDPVSQILSNKNIFNQLNDSDLDFQECKVEKKPKSNPSKRKREDSDIACMVCKIDITLMTPGERSAHINQCIDQQPISNSDADSHAAPDVFILDCPLCFKSFAAPELRSSHIKKCGRSKGLSLQSIFKAMQLQEKHVLERQALGLPFNKARIQKETKRPPKKITAPKSAIQAEIQLAKALSLSLQANERQTEPNFEPLDNTGNGSIVRLRPPTNHQRPGKSPSKKKRHLIDSPMLLRISEQEREKIICTKVEEIVSSVINVVPGVDVENESKASAPELQPFWNLSSKAGDKSSYYVEQLLDWIMPSSVEVGSKMCNLSQVAGHQIYTQLPLDYTFSTTSDQNESESCPPPEHSKQSSSLMDCLRSLIGNSFMSDVDIHTASGVVVPAHKLMLGIRCPSLRAIFESTQSDQKCILDWKNTSFEAALHFLNFIYTGSTEWKEDIVEELFKLAEKYEVQDLLNIMQSDFETLELLTTENSTQLLREKMGNKQTDKSSPPSLLITGYQSNALLCLSDQDYNHAKNTGLGITDNYTSAERNSSLELNASHQMDLETTISNTSIKTNNLSEEIGEESDSLVLEMDADSQSHETLNESKVSADCFELTNPKETEFDLLKKDSDSYNTNRNANNIFSNFENDSSNDSCEIIGVTNNSQFSSVEDDRLGEKSSQLIFCSSSPEICNSEDEVSVIREISKNSSQHSSAYLEINVSSPEIVESSFDVPNLKVASVSNIKSTEPSLITLVNFDIDRNRQETLNYDDVDKESSVHDGKSEALNVSCTEATEIKGDELDDFAKYVYDPDNLGSPVANLNQTNENKSHHSSELDTDKPETFQADEEPFYADHCYDLDLYGTYNDYVPDKNDNCKRSDNDVGGDNIVVDNVPSPFHVADKTIRSSQIDHSEKENVPVESSSNENSRDIEVLPLEDRLAKRFHNEIENVIVGSSSDENGRDMEVLPLEDRLPKRFPDEVENVFVGSSSDENSRDGEVLPLEDRLAKGLHDEVENIAVESSSDENSSDVEILPLEERLAKLLQSNANSLKDKPINDCKKMQIGSLKIGKTRTSLEEFQKPRQRKKQDTCSSTLEKSKTCPVQKLNPQNAETSANDKKVSTPSEARHKFRISDSPVTPLPDYKTMMTPEIKEALKKIGVRAMSKRKAIAVLSHVYDETHPWNGESDGCTKTISEPTQSCAVPVKRRKQAIKSKNGAERKTSKPSSASERETSKQSSSLERKTSKQSSALESKTSKHSSTSRSKSSFAERTNSYSSNSENEEEDLYLSTLGDTGSSQSATKNDPKQITEYIKSNKELYTKILLYTPLNLAELHQELKENEVKVSMKSLMDYLDEQCITFTCPRNEEQQKKRNARTQRFRKNMIAKLSQANK